MVYLAAMRTRGTPSSVAPVARCAAALAVVALVMGGVVAVAGPRAGSAQETTNRWLTTHRIVNMAHGGGLREVPQGTMYAYRTAAERGADVLEMDLHITRDGHVVAIHDSTVDRTTDGTGCVVSKTLAEIKALDAAHTFVPGVGPASGRPASDYPLRGVATGAVPPPAGFTAADFTIVTLEELFQELPEALMLMELKPTEVSRGHDCPGFVASLPPEERPDLPAEVARLIAEYGMTDQVMVASFVDAMMAEFQAHAPGVDTSFPQDEAIALYVAYLQGNPAPNPNGHEAVQLPTSFSGIQMTEELVDYAHANGIAVHFWTINSPAQMTELLDWGSDGLITDVPQVLDALLRERGDPRPQRASTTTLALDGDPTVAYGAPVALTASVTAAAPGAPLAGTVELRSGADVLATATVADDGTAPFVLDDLLPGRHDLVAAYTGTDRLAPSTSAPVTVTVDPVAVAMSVEVTAPVAPGTAGTAVVRVEPVPPTPLSARAGSRADAGATPTGEVTVHEGDNEVGRASLADGVANVDLSPLGAGRHELVASYAGDAVHGTARAEFIVVVDEQATTSSSTSTSGPTSSSSSTTDDARGGTTSSPRTDPPRRGSGPLARTGFSPAPLLSAAAVLLLAGAIALVSRRRLTR